MPKVSVIIPTYNSARYLPEAIESVLAQTYRDFEIVVIDDGSTDNTKEVVAPYLDRIIFLEVPNGGPAKARNRAIRKSSGEYVAFLDADDIWYGICDSTLCMGAGGDTTYVRREGHSELVMKKLQLIDFIT
jgi:glycosyltransferase involved in cell wall biosynthesis